MSKLYDHKSGQWIVAPEDKVDDLVKSGNYTFAEGERIPVVAPDGELGDIPAEKAHDAFKDGFRWATAADKQFDNERKIQAIREKAGDNTSTAIGMGVLRGGSLGLSDVALRAGEESGLLPEGVVQQAADTKEYAPVASGVGEVGGIIGSTLLSGGSNLLGTTGKIGQGGYKLGSELGAKALAAAAGKEAKETLARKIIAKVVPVATGSAVENAIYGLGQGVSEAALGKPDDVVDNLVSGVGMGALTGLTFGAGIGAAGAIGKPILAKAAAAGSNLFEKAITGSARLGTKVVTRAALNAAGETRLAGMVGDLVDTEVGQVARSLAQDGKWDEAQALIKAAGKSEQGLVQQSKDLNKGLNKFLANEAREVSVIAKEAVARSGGNLNAAMHDLNEQIKNQYAAYETGLQALSSKPAVFVEVVQTPATKAARSAADAYLGVPEEVAAAATKKISSVQKWADDAANSLRKIGTREAVAKAAEIDSVAAARLPTIKNMYDEVQALRVLKDTANDGLDMLGREGYKKGKKFVNLIDDKLKNYPEEYVSLNQSANDATYSAFSAIRNVVGKGEGVKNGFTKRMLADPEYLDNISPALTQISAFSPEVTAFAAAGKDASKKWAAAEAFKRKLAAMPGNNKNGKLSTTDIENMLIELTGGAGKKFKHLEELKTLEAQLADLHTLQPVDRAVRVLKATGQDASKIEKLIPYQKELQALDDIRSIRPDGNFVGDIVGRAVKGTIGGALGGPFGAAIGAAMGGGVSVNQMLRNLTAVERLANKGAKLMEASINNTATALTSPTVRRIGAITRRQAEQEGPSLKQKRSEYKALVPKIQAAAGDPNVVADHVASAFGTLQGTPLLKQAMATKMTIASQYLAQHMPKDPLAGRYLTPDASGWEPSDSELSKFHRRMAVVQDPKVAMTKIADGSVSPEEMDALKTVYPEIFNKLKAQMTEQLMVKGVKIPYDKRIAIGTLFGIPTDPSLEPEMMAKLQSTFDPEEDQGGRPEGSKSSGRKPNLETEPSESVATETSQFQQ